MRGSHPPCFISTNSCSASWNFSLRFYISRKWILSLRILVSNYQLHKSCIHKVSTGYPTNRHQSQQKTDHCFWPGHLFTRFIYVIFTPSNKFVHQLSINYETYTHKRHYWGQLAYKRITYELHLLLELENTPFILSATFAWMNDRRFLLCNLVRNTEE